MISLNTIRKAVALFWNDNIHGVLVGTAGLALHGYRVEPSGRGLCSSEGWAWQAGEEIP